LDPNGPGTRLRQVLHDYFAWAATTTTARYHRSADDVPDGLVIPRWSWDGLREDRSDPAHQRSLALSDLGHQPVSVRSKLYRDAR
jgi:hypothetical protein